MSTDSTFNECQADRERRKNLDSEALAHSDGEFEKQIHFRVGYDHRAFPKLCGGGGHGQHGMEMVWYLKGPAGAIQWVVFLSDFTPTNISSLGDINGRSGAMAADLGYHSFKPQYEDQPDYGPCKVLGTEQCYYDGSGLAAGEVLKKFVVDGPDAVWAHLREWYDLTFVASSSNGGDN